MILKINQKNKDTNRFKDFVIIGFGASGIACAIELTKKRIPFIVFEKRATFGGCWNDALESSSLQTHKNCYKYHNFDYYVNVGDFPTKTDILEYFDMVIEKYKLNRIAIIDFDVHHGNGTQDIFYENQKVLYISTHQYPFYPGTGSVNEKGKYNNILNIPLPAGTNSEEYLNAYEHVLKKLGKFKPEFLLFSAGFDAHADDPLAQFMLKSEDFYIITKRTLAVANKSINNKVVSILEGGYDLNALKESTEMHLKALNEN